MQDQGIGLAADALLNPFYASPRRSHPANGLIGQEDAQDPERHGEFESVESSHFFGEGNGIGGVRPVTSYRYTTESYPAAVAYGGRPFSR